MENLSDLIRQVTELAESEAPLDRLKTAVEASGQLSSLADELVSHFVEEARKSGASWSEVGTRLGVTKQAAQQRFVPFTHKIVASARKRAGRGTPSNIFDRFTDRAKRVITRAQQEAGRLDHDYLGTEHMLLGLLADKGSAHKMLKERGLAIEQARTEVERLADRGTGAVEHPPFTPGSKKVIELALREALRFRGNHVTSIHLLLGLSREGEGIAAQILTGFHISYDDIKDWAKNAPGEAAL